MKKKTTKPILLALTFMFSIQIPTQVKTISPDPELMYYFTQYILILLPSIQMGLFNAPGFLHSKKTHNIFRIIAIFLATANTFSLIQYLRLPKIDKLLRALKRRLGPHAEILSRSLPKDRSVTAKKITQALFIAARNSYVNVFKNLTRQYRICISTRDAKSLLDDFFLVSDQKDPNKEQIVRHLFVSGCIDQNASLQIFGLHHPVPPLVAAAFYGKRALVRCLIEECGAKINAENENGQTALLQAVAGFVASSRDYSFNDDRRNRCHITAKYLIEHDANPHISATVSYPISLLPYYDTRGTALGLLNLFQEECASEDSYHVTENHAELFKKTKTLLDAIKEAARKRVRKKYAIPLSDSDLCLPVDLRRLLLDEFLPDPMQLELEPD